MAKLDGFDAMVTGEIVLNAAGTRAQLTMVDASQIVLHRGIDVQPICCNDRSCNWKQIGSRVGFRFVDQLPADQLGCTASSFDQSLPRSNRRNFCTRGLG